MTVLHDGGESSEGEWRMISTKKVLFKIWVLKLVIIGFHEPRDNFPFPTVRMPHLCRNIPSKIFYFTFGVEILRVARTTSKCHKVRNLSKAFFSRAQNQGVNTGF